MAEQTEELQKQLENNFKSVLGTVKTYIDTKDGEQNVLIEELQEAVHELQQNENGGDNGGGAIISPNTKKIDSVIACIGILPNMAKDMFSLGGGVPS